MDAQQTRNILEACLLVAGRAMSVAQLEALFESDIDRPDRKEIKLQLEELQKTYEGRGIELIEVASGWRLQSRSSMEHWVARLFTEKSPRYSRALLETLVLIAYRQPITRGEIEEIRGVAVSSNIIRTLQEREWVKEVGVKEVPGRPALLGTTRQFLDYFNLKRLDELPPLSEIKDLEEIDATLAAEMGIGVEATDVAEAIIEAGELVASDENAGADTGADSGDAEVDGESSNESSEVAEVSESADIAEVSDTDLVSDTDEADDTAEATSTDDADEAADSGLEANAESDGSDEADDESVEDQGSDSGDGPDSNGTPPSNDGENDALGELDPQTELRRVINEFASEHQRELDVQKGIDTQNLTTVEDKPDPQASDELLSDVDSDSDAESTVVKKALVLESVAEHDSVSLDSNPDIDAESEGAAEVDADSAASTSKASEPDP